MSELAAVSAAGYALIAVSFGAAVIVLALVVASWRETILRWWCRRYGHAPLAETRAEPVIPMFFVCRRCGKWTRTLEELTALDPARRAGVRIGSER